MRFGNVLNATEYQERGKMAKWELIDRDNFPCDLCAIPTHGVSIYRKETQLSGWKFDYMYVCKKCEPEWLKSNDQFT